MQVNSVILHSKICPIDLYVESGSSKWFWVTCEVFYSGNIEVKNGLKKGQIRQKGAKTGPNQSNKPNVAVHLG